VPTKANGSVLISENAPWLKQPATAAPEKPSVETKQQSLPYGDLTWENFERLCLRLAEIEGEAEYWALYGTKGQSQDGIDIYVRHDGARSYSVWQSKKYKKTTPTSIRKAAKEFLAGKWVTKSSTFYLCFQTSIQETKVQDELEKQASVLARRGITLIPLGAAEMSRRLKKCPEIVDDFFGRNWTIAFCGEDAVRKFGNRLDAADIARLRSELLTQYSSNFSSVDPGIASAITASQQRQLPLVRRFIEPDITLEDASSSFITRPSHSDESEEDRAAPSILNAPSTQRASTTRPPIVTAVRRPLTNWLTEVDQAAIIAPAGYGKSSFLRALALDLLSDGNLFPDLTKRWGDRIPIVLPFASWTRLIATGIADISLADAIRSWFKRFQLSEDLLELIVSSLKDNRMILLIDGLDEWTNQEAARSALTLLDTFIKSHSINAVVTTRPGGVAKLGTLDPMWRSGNLAPLGDEQQRRLAFIWFSHLKAVPDGSHVKREFESSIARDIEAFFEDLNGRGMLMPLAGVPLLLSGLISLAVRSVVLPRNRFHAYSELIKLLLDEHPKRRAAASMPAAARSIALSDSALVRRALSALAYHNRVDNVGASTPYADAKNVIVEYLQSTDGAGLAPADAVAAANDLLTLDAETTGLLVQRAPDEVGFLHSIFEEYLAGCFAASFDIEKQKMLVDERIGDPKWINVLLSMLHNLSRPNEIETLVRVALGRADDQSHAKLARQLAAEVAFGAFRCPPKYALEIATEVFATIESGSWPQERQALLSVVLDAGALSPLTDSLRRKLSDWMPDSIQFRVNIYRAMAEWKSDPQLVDCLWQGLFNEEAENRKAAGRALVRVSRGDPEVGDRLFNLICEPVDAEIVASALATLYFGWPTYPGLSAVIDQAKKSPVPALRVTAILCAIKSGIKDENDLDALLSLGHSTQYLYPSYAGEIIQGLIEGWPDSEKIYDLAIRSVQQRGFEREFNREAAKSYLLAASKLSPKRDSDLADVIRNDKFFFSFLGVVNFVSDKHGPEVLSAIDDRLTTLDKFRSNDIANLALITKSRRAKGRLLELLSDPEESGFKFWPVWGLLTGWGMQDDEVREALEPLAHDPPEKVQYIAHHLTAILGDKVRSREILLTVARLTNVKRLDFLASGFQRAGSDHNDAEVVEALLNHDLSRRGVFDATGDLIGGFGKHPKVRALALERIKEVDAPWASLASAYGDDEEFRGIIVSRLRSISSDLRSSIAIKAGRVGNSDSVLFNCVRQYPSESIGAVKVLAVKSFCETIRSDDVASESGLDQLKREVQATGPYMDITRQAAIAGLVTFSRLDLFRDLCRYDGKPEDISTYFPENRVLVAHLARNWSYIKSALGGAAFERMSRHGGNHWYAWDHFAPYVGESDALRDEFLSYCANEAKALSSNCLEALSRIQPRSNLLLETCLKTLDIELKEDVNSSPLDQQRRALVVGQILGRQFSRNDDIRVTLERRLHLEDSASVVGLSLGWPTSDKLNETYNAIRQDGWSGQRIQWPSALQIAGALGGIEEFKYLLEFIVSNGAGYIWEFLDFCVLPIIARLKRDGALASYCLDKLRDNPTSGHKASFPRLLVGSTGLSDELRNLCEAYYAEECVKGQLSESGLDIIAGQVRPVGHSLLDALVPHIY
jgi:hypothetical protein